MCVYAWVRAQRVYIFFLLCTEMPQTEKKSTVPQFMYSFLLVNINENMSDRLPFQVSES